MKISSSYGGVLLRNFSLGSGRTTSVEDEKLGQVVNRACILRAGMTVKVFTDGWKGG